MSDSNDNNNNNNNNNTGNGKEVDVDNNTLNAEGQKGTGQGSDESGKQAEREVRTLDKEGDVAKNNASEDSGSSNDSEKSKDADRKEVEYSEVGNETLDSLGYAIADKGLDPSVYFNEVGSQLKEGKEASLTQESFDELKEAFGEKLALAMERQVANETKNVLDQQRKKTDAVYEQFGGKEKLEQMASAIRKEGKATDDEAKELTKMLFSGGIQQDLAVSRIKELYMSTEGYTQTPSIEVEGDNKQPTGLQPISRTDYTRQKMEAVKKRDLVKVEELNKRARFTMENKKDVWR